MGTPQIPDSKPPETSSTEKTVDIPRVGWALWVALACFLIPPIGLTYIGWTFGPMPNQTLWIILLGCPIPLVLLLLPRKYLLDSKELAIIGLLYRLRIPREEIIGIERVPALAALFHPASMFCSNPSRALKVIRSGKRAIIISPNDPTPFTKMVKPPMPPEG